MLDDDALEGRLRYILSHGVKECLVRKPSEWPGLSCLPQLLGDSKRTFLSYSSPTHNQGHVTGPPRIKYLSGQSVSARKPERQGWLVG